MKYSLWSLMIVVTLAAVASALAARSRYCAEQAEIHRKGLPSTQEMKEFQAIVDETRVPFAEHYMTRLRFRHETAAAYERVARKPWLPLLLPKNPPETSLPPQCSLALTEQERAILEKAADEIFDP